MTGDWVADERALDVGFATVYTGPTCPGCLWPYDPAQDETGAECCPACRAEDAANGEA